MFDFDFKPPYSLHSSSISFTLVEGEGMSHFIIYFQESLFINFIFQTQRHLKSSLIVEKGMISLVVLKVPWLFSSKLILRFQKEKKVAETRYVHFLCWFFCFVQLHIYVQISSNFKLQIVPNLQWFDLQIFYFTIGQKW